PGPGAGASGGRGARGRRRGGRRRGWPRRRAAATRARARPASVPLSGVQLAESGETVEVLQEGLREGGEAGAAARRGEPRREEIVRLVRDLAVRGVEDARALQVRDVPQELVPVELGERQAFLGIHRPSVNGNVLASSIFQASQVCQLEEA